MKKILCAIFAFLCFSSKCMHNVDYSWINQKKHCLIKDAIAAYEAMRVYNNASAEAVPDDQLRLVLQSNRRIIINITDEDRLLLGVEITDEYSKFVDPILLQAISVEDFFINYLFELSCATNNTSNDNLGGMSIIDESLKKYCAIFNRGVFSCKSLIGPRGGVLAYTDNIICGSNLQNSYKFKSLLFALDIFDNFFIHDILMKYIDKEYDPVLATDGRDIFVMKDIYINERYMNYDKLSVILSNNRSYIIKRLIKVGILRNSCDTIERLVRNGLELPADKLSCYGVCDEDLFFLTKDWPKNRTIKKVNGVCFVEPIDEYKESLDSASNSYSVYFPVNKHEYRHKKYVGIPLQIISSALEKQDFTVAYYFVKILLNRKWLDANKVFMYKGENNTFLSVFSINLIDEFIKKAPKDSEEEKSYVAMKKIFIGKPLKTWLISTLLKKLPSDNYADECLREIDQKKHSVVRNAYDYYFDNIKQYKEKMNIRFLAGIQLCIDIIKAMTSYQ